MSGPIFVGGCARSGTTLVQLLLDRHPDVTMAFETLFPITTRCDDLDWSSAVSLRCAERIVPELDARTAVQGLEVEALAHALERAKPLSWSDCCRAVIGFVRGRSTPRWGIKSPFLQFHADAIVVRFDDARIVLMVRDARDVCASLVEFVPSVAQADAAARWWLRCLSAAERAQRDYPKNVRLLRYEDLVGEPERELSGLCDFLELDFDPRMLDGEAPLAGIPEVPPGMFVSPRITAGRIGRHVRALGSIERFLVEATASDALYRWGYGLPPFLQKPLTRTLARVATDAVARPTWPARRLACHLFGTSRPRANSR